MKIIITEKNLEERQFFKRAVITQEPHETEILLTADLGMNGGVIKIEGPATVIVESGVELNSLYAQDADVIVRDGGSLMAIVAKSLKAGGGLYVPNEFRISGDAEIAGELGGERHFEYEVGGDLTADGIDIDGYLNIGGNLTTSWIQTRGTECLGVQTIGEQDRPGM